MTVNEAADHDEALTDWLPPVGDSSFRIRCSDSSPDLCVVSARDHAHPYPAHLHGCVELVWVHSGRARITCRGETYHLQAGDVCVIAPYELHSAQTPSRTRCTFTIMHLPSHFYWRIIDENPRLGRLPEPFRVLRYQALGLSIQGLFEGIASAADDDQRSDTLSRLLATVLDAPSFASVRGAEAICHPAVVHARGVIAQHHDRVVDLQEIATEVGLNMRYLISLFREGTGLPPHQYQIAVRVEKARELLQTSNAELSDVALAAGFCDQSHFSRLFKRSYGFSPGVFKQLLRPI